MIILLAGFLGLPMCFVSTKNASTANWMVETHKLTITTNAPKVFYYCTGNGIDGSIHNQVGMREQIQ